MGQRGDGSERLKYAVPICNYPASSKTYPSRDGMFQTLLAKSSDGNANRPLVLVPHTGYRTQPFRYKIAKAAGNTALVLENHVMDSRISVRTDGTFQALVSNMWKGQMSRPLIYAAQRYAWGSAAAMFIENHPHDSRIKVRRDGTSQSLTSRMGTGGNAIPIVYQHKPNETDVYVFPHDPRHGGVSLNEAHPCMASDYKLPQQVFAVSHPVLRAITPTECARLQGFPDEWCDGLVYDDPDENEMTFWRKTWDTWCGIQGIKRKSDNQIRKWLMTQPPEAAQYKMWGNGVALPCVEWILKRIVWAQTAQDDWDPAEMNDVPVQLSLF